MSTQIINNTIMNILFFAPSIDEYIYIPPGGDITALPEDAEFIQELYNEHLLQYSAYAHTMIQTNVYMESNNLLQ